MTTALALLVGGMSPLVVLLVLLGMRFRFVRIVEGKKSHTEIEIGINERGSARSKDR